MKGAAGRQEGTMRSGARERRANDSQLGSRFWRDMPAWRHQKLKENIEKIISRKGRTSEGHGTDEEADDDGQKSWSLLGDCELGAA